MCLYWFQLLICSFVELRYINFFKNRVACLCTAVHFIASLALWGRENSARQCVSIVVTRLTLEFVVVVIREEMCWGSISCCWNWYISKAAYLFKFVLVFQVTKRACKFTLTMKTMRSSPWSLGLESSRWSPLLGLSPCAFVPIVTPWHCRTCGANPE